MNRNLLSYVSKISNFGTIKALVDINNGNHYYTQMIKSFKCKETEKIANYQFSKKLPQSIQRTALKKLILIKRSKNLNDLRVPPSNHLEALSGNRKGQYSLRINDQWRICFAWKDGDAYNVEIEDYH